MRYTDIDNTGLAAVPDLDDRDDDRTGMEEQVWSHRLTVPVPRDDE